MYHLGSALLASALCQALPDRKEDERIDFQWKVDQGPFGSLFVECRNRRQVRGTILHAQTAGQELKIPMGPGLLQVRRLDAKVELPLSTGIVPASGDVVQDVLNYLDLSEQKMCALSIFIDISWDDHGENEKLPFRINHARAFLVHVLPQKDIAKTHEVLFQWDQHIQELGPLSSWELGAKPASTILKFISGEQQPNVTWEEKLESFCNCDEDRAARALAFIDRQDFVEKVPSTPQAGSIHEVRCEFCGRTYTLKSMALS
jgi:redox-regulated HSP33 family molecular chaperone